MNYGEWLEYIHSLGNFSLPAGLERISGLLAALGNPQNKLKAIHIAGTNGKGSVSAMLASVFKAADLKTGLFISPFIIDFRERIQIDGRYISEADLCGLAERVKNCGIRLTEFEFITACAFLYFAEQKCDIVICETGLGGRLDATNTLGNKLAAVITKIGLDHTAILGDTIEKIAAEKCGIIKNCPTVTNPNQEKAVYNIINKCTDKLFVPDLKQLEKLPSDRIGNTFIYKGERYFVPLCGDFQVENAVTAIEAVKVSGYGIPYNIIYKGLESVKFPARMEVLCECPLVVLDGAHNPDGGKVLANELKKYSGKVTAVIGMMRDKDYEDFLRLTLSHCENAVAVTVEGMPRSLSAEELSLTAQKICPCEIAESYSDALKLARKLAGENPVFIFGSLYLAADVRRLLKPEDYLLL